MSIQALTWVIYGERRTSNADFRTLLVLADHADLKAWERIRAGARSAG